MKDIKNTLNEYKERPNDEVWKKLDSMLDSEMPTKAQNSIQKVLKVAIISILGIALSSIIAVLVLKEQHQNSQSKADNQEYSQIVVNKSITTDEAIVEGDEQQLANSYKPKTESVQIENFIHKTEPTDNKEIVISDKPKEETRETNIAQIVLPANSTLARQLQSDPILKNLDGENIDFAPPVKLQIPNLFTPNGDGINDKFVIEGLENYDKKALTVYDKNGKIVFQSGNYKNNWSGENCSDGLYNYEFTFSYKGIENIATGKVRILRN